MEFLHYATLLARQALGFLYLYWPVTVVLATGFIGTLVINSPFFGKGPSFRPRHLFLVLPMLLSVVTLALGSLSLRPPGVPLPAWPDHVVTALFGIQMFASIGILLAMKGCRVFAAFTLGLQLWFGLACSLVTSLALNFSWP